MRYASGTLTRVGSFASFSVWNKWKLLCDCFSWYTINIIYYICSVCLIFSWNCSQGECIHFQVTLSKKSLPSVLWAGFMLSTSFSTEHTHLWPSIRIRYLTITESWKFECVASHQTLCISFCDTNCHEWHQRALLSDLKISQKHDIPWYHLFIYFFSQRDKVWQRKSETYIKSATPAYTCVHILLLTKYAS